MGLDGFSMSNLGMYNKMTSAQMAMDVDDMLARGDAHQIKDIEAAGRQKGVERKDVDYSDAGGGAFGGGSTGEESDESLPKPENEMNDDDPERSPDRYIIKINEDANIVELYDTLEQVVVQRLSTNQLISMLRNFNDPSGILFSKKI